MANRERPLRLDGKADQRSGRLPAPAAPQVVDACALYLRGLRVGQGCDDPKNLVDAGQRDELSDNAARLADDHRTAAWPLFNSSSQRNATIRLSGSIVSRTSPSMRVPRCF